MALAQDNANGYYQKAYQQGIKNLAACNETRLGAAMNYTVFLVDVLGRNDQAIKISHTVIEEAEINLDKQSSLVYDEVKNIIEMIKENVNTWTGKDKEDAKGKGKGNIKIQAHEYAV